MNSLGLERIDNKSQDYGSEILLLFQELWEKNRIYDESLAPWDPRSKLNNLLMGTGLLQPIL